MDHKLTKVRDDGSRRECQMVVSMEGSKAKTKIHGSDSREGRDKT